MSDIFTGFLNSHQQLAGYTLLALGSLCTTALSFMKSAGDKAASSIEPQRKWNFYTPFFVLTLICYGLSAYGAFMVKNAGEAASKAKESEANKKLDAALSAQRKTVEMLQSMAVKLNVAQHSDSVEITEAKIQVLRGGLGDFARNVITNSEEKKLFVELKRQQATKNKEMADHELEERIKRSEQCFPVFSFTIRYFQEAVMAFATQSGQTNITIEPFSLPSSIYAQDVLITNASPHFRWPFRYVYGPNGEHPLSASINLKTNLSWMVSIQTGYGARVLPYEGYDSIHNPYLAISFDRLSGGQPDTLVLQLNNEGTKIHVTYKSALPVPDPDKISEEYEIRNFEEPLTLILQSIVKSQWLDATESD